MENYIIHYDLLEMKSKTRVVYFDKMSCVFLAFTINASQSVQHVNTKQHTYIYQSTRTVLSAAIGIKTLSFPLSSIRT